MPAQHSQGKPTTLRYSSEEKAAALRMVRLLRTEFGNRARGGAAGRRAAWPWDRVGAVLGAAGRRRRGSRAGGEAPQPRLFAVEWLSGPQANVT